MDLFFALFEPLAALVVFGGLFLVCLYGWFMSERAYMTGPSTFSQEAHDTKQSV